MQPAAAKGSEQPHQQQQFKHAIHPPSIHALSVGTYINIRISREWGATLDSEIVCPLDGRGRSADPDTISPSTGTVWPFARTILSGG